MIRDARPFDKPAVLRFCRDTFSWGDYVEHVWDCWLDEGLLFVCDEQSPVGICHGSLSEGQIWIEGIRIDPNFRRRGIASGLVRHAESAGQESGASLSYMLVETGNEASLSLAKSLGYDMLQTWNFYSLAPKHNSGFDVTFPDTIDEPHYVKSWRWVPLGPAMPELAGKNGIVRSCDGLSAAVLSDSEHFENTLMVTLFSGSEDASMHIVSFLQDHAAQNGYDKIQVLSKEALKPVPLERRLSFHLLGRDLV